MATQHEALSAIIALQFVAAAAVVFLLVPLEAAAPVLPLFLVLAFALYRYVS